MPPMTMIDPRVERTLAALKLGEASRGLLSTIARVYSVPTRTQLLHKGDTTEELSVLVSGRAVLTDHLPGRGSMRLLTLEEGDIFGWSALIEPFHAVSDVLSLTPAEIVAFDGAALRAAMEQDVALAADVRRVLLDSLAARLAATRHQLFDLYGAGWAEPIYEPW